MCRPVSGVQARGLFRRDGASGTHRRGRRWLAKCGAAHKGLTLPRPHGSAIVPRAGALPAYFSNATTRNAPLCPALDSGVRLSEGVYRGDAVLDAVDAHHAADKAEQK
jgi:hypothetical protein